MLIGTPSNHATKYFIALHSLIKIKQVYKINFPINKPTAEAINTDFIGQSLM